MSQPWACLIGGALIAAISIFSLCSVSLEVHEGQGGGGMEVVGAIVGLALVLYGILVLLR